MPGRKLRTSVLIGLGILGIWSLAVLTSTLNQSDDTSGSAGRGHHHGHRHVAGGPAAADAAAKIEEIPLNVAVGELRRKMNQLRKPVEALMHRLEEVNVQNREAEKARGMPHNYHLIWHENPPRDKRIFVGLTSYDGLACRKTIKTIFEQATNPSLIFVGVTEVHAPDTPTCEDPEYRLCNISVFCPTDQIRRRVISQGHFKGPMHALATSSYMYHGEQYVLMMRAGAHRFEHKWDSTLLEEYHQVTALSNNNNQGFDKAVITGYPRSYSEQEAQGKNFSQVVLDKNCKTDLSGSSPSLPIAVPTVDKNPVSFEWNSITIRKWDQEVNLEQQQGGDLKGVETPFASYNFLFGQKELLVDVPIDPYISYFTPDEEDLLLSTKLYTHGYNFFLSRRSATWIEAGHEKEVLPKPGDMSAVQLKVRTEAIIRAADVLGLIRDSDVRRIPGDHPSLKQKSHFEGLGKLKTPGQFFTHAGLDLHKRVAKDVCELGKK